MSPLAAGPLSPTLRGRQKRGRALAVHRLARVEMRELRQADRNHGDRDARVTEAPQIAERLLEHLAVVEARYDHHLAMELDAAGRQPTQLRHDVRNARIVEQ